MRVSTSGCTRNFIKGKRVSDTTLEAHIETQQELCSTAHTLLWRSLCSERKWGAGRLVKIKRHVSLAKFHQFFSRSWVECRSLSFSLIFLWTQEPFYLSPVSALSRSVHLLISSYVVWSLNTLRSNISKHEGSDFCLMGIARTWHYWM
jgi:hypothetical protein